MSIKYPKAIKAWTIIKDGRYQFDRWGTPELHATRRGAELVNVDTLNGAQVIALRISPIKPKRRKRK